MGIQEFIETLSRTQDSAYLANPYRTETCRENLRQYLEHIQDEGFDIMLVGEAPGYKGCAKTGIPFTDELQLASPENEFILGPWKKPALGSNAPKSGERTASAVWPVLRELHLVPLMWNIFPFHPHKELNAHSNRPPTSDEQQEGLAIIKELISFMGVERDDIYAVGRKAQATLGLDDSHYICHPSYGKSKVFAEQLKTKMLERHQ